MSNSQRIEEFLRFGMYPRVTQLGSLDDKENHLYDLINNYLYRDILAFEQVRKPKKVIDLLSLLALQVGAEVSTAELASHLAISRPIAEKYLDILEKMFVIVNLRGFSRNLRKEISKSSKYYFVDPGFRNALPQLQPAPYPRGCGRAFRELRHPRADESLCPPTALRQFPFLALL